MPNFQKTVIDAWNEEMTHTEPYQILFHKLKRTSQRLRTWSKAIFSNHKDQLHMALEIILRLDVAQELRTLSPTEWNLRKELKRKVLALAVLQRARKRLSSRITLLKEGDANTRFFHLRINHRRRKNFIHRLKHNNGWATHHDHKKEIIQQHFSKAIGKAPPRAKDFNWDCIPHSALDLAELGNPFTEEEVHAAINNLPSDKAPGPDGFTGVFFKECWDIVRPDIMRVINNFSTLHISNLHWLNSANIALIPKKEGAEDISEFRPISLIHAVAKIIAKMMATRLAPHMSDLVSNTQSAFIKKRSIHDNFMYVRNLARRFHRNKSPTLLFKLDIKKAFDSVRWDYLMDLLRHHNFPSRFRDWISALLSTASSRVLLNGVPGDPISHGCGLRQGDPLSPLLFVLAIDPLHHILAKATEQGKLRPLRGNPTRASLYADDAAIFVAPIKEDIQFLASTLGSFGEVTGLVTSYNKSHVAPTKYESIMAPTKYVHDGRNSTLAN